MPVIKSAKEIDLMRTAGRILGRVHEELAQAIVPGMSTLDIDRICEELIRSYGCIPSFLNYEGFLLQSVYLSTMRLYMGSRIRTVW